MGCVESQGGLEEQRKEQTGGTTKKAATGIGKKTRQTSV